MRGIEPAFTLLANPDCLHESLLDRIYRRLPGGKNVKTTWPHRYDELDRLTFRQVEMRFPAGRPLSVHDIAASNAITTVQLFHRLSESRSVEMKASDYYDSILGVRFAGLDFLFDAAHEPLQIAVGKTGMSMRHGLWHYFVAPLWPIVRWRIDSADRIALFCTEALLLAATNPSFRLAREDLFDLSAERYDVVRLANAHGALTDEQSRPVLGAIAETVNEGGLWIVGRGDNFSIFVRQKGRFSEVETLGQGFNHAKLVLSLVSMQ